MVVLQIQPYLDVRLSESFGLGICHKIHGIQLVSLQYFLCGTQNEHPFLNNCELSQPSLILVQSYSERIGIGRIGVRRLLASRHYLRLFKATSYPYLIHRMFSIRSFSFEIFGLSLQVRWKTLVVVYKSSHLSISLCFMVYGFNNRQYKTVLVRPLKCH